MESEKCADPVLDSIPIARAALNLAAKCVGLNPMWSIHGFSVVRSVLRHFMAHTHGRRSVVKVGKSDGAMARPWEHQAWVEPYQLAVLEVDPRLLDNRILTAESAIQARIAELGDTRDILEPSALHGALHVLRLLAKQASLRKRAA